MTSTIPKQVSPNLLKYLADFGSIPTFTAECITALQNRDWDAFQAAVAKRGYTLTSEDIASAARLLDIGPAFNIIQCAGIYKFTSPASLEGQRLIVDPITGSIRVNVNAVLEQTKVVTGGHVSWKDGNGYRYVITFSYFIDNDGGPSPITFTGNRTPPDSSTPEQFSGKQILKASILEDPRFVIPVTIFGILGVSVGCLLSCARKLKKARQEQARLARVAQGPNGGTGPGVEMKQLNQGETIVETGERGTQTNHENGGELGGEHGSPESEAVDRRISEILSNFDLAVRLLQQHPILVEYTHGQNFVQAHKLAGQAIANGAAQSSLAEKTKKTKAESTKRELCKEFLSSGMGGIKKTAVETTAAEALKNHSAAEGWLNKETGQAKQKTEVEKLVEASVAKHGSLKLGESKKTTTEKSKGEWNAQTGKFEVINEHDLKERLEAEKKDAERVEAEKAEKAEKAERAEKAQSKKKEIASKAKLTHAF